MPLTRVLLLLSLGVAASGSTIDTSVSCGVGAVVNSGATSCRVDDGPSTSIAWVRGVSLPDSGAAGNFGFSYNVTTVSRDPNDVANATLSALLSETVVADGPLRAGFADVYFTGQCDHLVGQCSAFTSFGGYVPGKSQITIPVELGDAVPLAASVVVKCSAFVYSESICASAGEIRVYFQFYEADRATPVGFTEYVAPANLAVVDNPEPASFILLLVPAYLIKRWNLARLRCGVQR